MAELSIFGQQDASSSFDHYIQELKTEINNKTNDYILNVNVSEWKEYFIEKYNFLPLTVYPEKVVVEFRRKGKAKREQLGREYEIETYIFELSVPFTGWSFLFMLKPSTCTILHPRVNVPQADGGFVTANFVLYDQNENTFEYEKNQLLKAITVNVPNINNDLNSFKANVVRTFDSTYQQKRDKVLSENSFFEKLNININKSTDQYSGNILKCI